MVCVCYNAITVLSQIWKIIWTISESGQWTIDEYVLPASPASREYVALKYCKTRIILVKPNTYLNHRNVQSSTPHIVLK